MKYRTQAFVIASALLASCSGGARLDDQISGEWMLYVSRPQVDSTRQPERHVGVMVFDAELPCYCEEISDVESEAVIGRAYVDLNAIAPSQYPRRATRFGNDSHADMRQEVIARFNPDGRVAIQTVGMSGLTFVGVLTNGSIRGVWTYDEHGRSLAEGEFLLMRTRPTYYSDSARIRAHREVSRWRAGAAMTD